MKSVLKLVLATVVLFSFAAAAQAETTIIVVSHGQASDPFWSVVKNGSAQAAEDYGVKVDYRAPETFDMVAMAQLIDAAVNQEPDGLIVSIPDADALGPSIRKAVAAGISVISMNSGSDVSKKLGALLHVGQEEYDAGLIAGEKLASLGGKTGLCINHEVGNVSLDARCAGFTKGFGGKVTVLPTSNDPGEIKSKVKAALDSNPEIDTVIALGASLAGEPAVAAVEELGKGGKINVGSFDLSASFLKSVSAGKAAFAIDQQQYLQGYLPVVFLVKYLETGTIPGGGDVIRTGPGFVTQETAADVIDLSARGIR